MFDWLLSTHVIFVRFTDALSCLLLMRLLSVTFGSRWVCKSTNGARSLIQTNQLHERFAVIFVFTESLQVSAAIEMFHV
jgi:hypothetical protein